MQKQSKIKSIFDLHPIFGVLKASTLENLVNDVRTLKFKKSEFVFHQHDEAMSAYVILEGQVMLETICPEGKTTVFAKVSQGDLFGEFAVLDSGTRSTNAQCITPTEIIAIPKDRLQRIILENPEFSMQLIKQFIGIIRTTDIHLESINFLSLQERTALLLSQILRKETSKQQNPVVTPVIKVTQVELARILSASREKVNIALNSLKEAGVIKLRRGEIEVTNLNKLKSLSKPKL